MSETLTEVKRKSPSLSEFTKVDVGVKTNESSQAVVIATPWPNSTFAPLFKLIFDARVVPKTDTPSKTTMPRAALSRFGPWPFEGSDGEKSIKGTR